MTEAQLRNHLAHEGRSDDEIEDIVDSYTDRKVLEDKDDTVSSNQESK